ncbi:phosphotransferase enzyme family protein [Kribbella catacumbae]|uniref:phosphotransferase enzyme family protein n=1 Tax=Kribbella catacumbae TaxID=460086 RepID=UPI000362F0EA|nr:aminoglycoside phosphotransferase family protein [Kribbella catacumbae]
MTLVTLEAMLKEACARVGLSSDGAELIRQGENALYRLPDHVVVRIARLGQVDAAKKEVAVSRWLASVGINAVEALEEIQQPVVLDGLPVTFWWELPDHRHGSFAEVAAALKQLHAAPMPTDFDLAPLAPFVRLSERIDGASTLSDDDRAWLRRRLDDLQQSYAELPSGLPTSVIHGDAWAGNVVATDRGDVILLDLERCSVGPPEWDLVSTAVRHSTFGTMSAVDYGVFAEAYGHDVMAWPGFEALRDVRELRVTCYAAQCASENEKFREEATLRVASLRGLRGTRPWPDWKPLT